MHSPYFYQNQVLNLEFLLTHSDLSKCNHWNKYKTATRSHSGHPQLTLISTHCILSTGLICMNQSILSTTYEVGSTGAPFLQVSTSSSISKGQSQDVYLGFVLGGPALALLSHAQHYLRTPPSAWERPGSWPHQPSPGTPAMRKPPRPGSNSGEPAGFPHHPPGSALEEAPRCLSARAQHHEQTAGSVRISVRTM